MNKAVILARGLGTRMRKDEDSAGLTAEQSAIAQTGFKALIPLGQGRPFLDYVLSSLADAGYKHVCLVIGPEHDRVRQYYTTGVECRRLKIDFAIQKRPLGTADAVASAVSFAGKDPFLMINSDNYYPAEALHGLRRLGHSGLAGFDRRAMLAASNIPPDRIGSFAVIETAKDGTLKRIIEKPGPEALQALREPVCVSMNCWRFDHDIFEACASIKPSPRGELELPLAVQYAIDEFDKKFRVMTCTAPVLDLSSRRDIVTVAKRLNGVAVAL